MYFSYCGWLQVAERALFLWNNDHIRNLIIQNHKVILPIIFPALEKNTRGHWNQAVQSLTLNVRKVFSDADQSLLDECLIKYQEDELKEKDNHKKRESTWIRLENEAASKSNESEVVSKFSSVALSSWYAVCLIRYTCGFTDPFIKFDFWVWPEWRVFRFIWWGRVHFEFRWSFWRRSWKRVKAAVFVDRNEGYPFCFVFTACLYHQPWICL